MIFRSVEGYTLVLLVAQIGLVAGLVAHQSSSTTDPTTLSHLQRSESTGSETKASTSRDRPLHLHVTASDPDPLGIAHVSGLYGPGTWSAWFLTIAASWWRRFIGSDQKVDINTWLFLFGTNWAAVAVFRVVHVLQQIPSTHPEYTAEFSQHMGAFGAAFNMLFWGIFHAMLQFLVIALASSSSHKINRLRTFIVGLALPLTSFSVSLYRLAFELDPRNGDASNLLPALYWQGMDAQTHDLTFIFAVASVCTLPIAAKYLHRPILSTVPTGIVRVLHPILTSKPVIWFVVFCIGAVYLMFLASIFLIIVTKDSLWIWGFVPFGLMMNLVVPIIPMLVTIGAIPIMSAIYVFQAYLKSESDAATSCFFMPCAPQSIMEEDQLFALLAGLFTFFWLELLPPILARLRARRRDRRLFVEQVEAGLRRLRPRQEDAEVEMESV